jgi:hypothetical protein
MDGPANRQVVQQAFGVVGGQVETCGRRLAVQAVRQAEEIGERVVGVGADSHRVRVRGGRGPVEAVAGAGLPGGRIGQPRGGAGRIHELVDRDIRGISRLLDMLQVLPEEMPADAHGGISELAARQVTDEGVDGFARRATRLP